MPTASGPLTIQYKSRFIRFRKNKSRGEQEKHVGIAGFPRGFEGPFITDSSRGINCVTADYGKM